MKRLSTPFLFLDRLSTKRNLFILFILSALFPALIFPMGGIDAGRIPDALFYYTPNQLIELLQSYSPDERSAYYLGAFLIDVLYPMAYSLLLAALLKMLLNKRGNRQSAWNYLCLLPFTAAFFDLAENITISRLLFTIDKPSLLLARAASRFTAIKWGLVFLSFIAILMLFVLTILPRKTALPKN